jgi:hypothetical protein
MIHICSLIVTLGTKYWESSTEPPKSKNSIPVRFRVPRNRIYWGKYRNRTEFTWNVMSLSVGILLIVLLQTIILCIFGTHTYSLVDFYMYMYFALLFSMKSCQNLILNLLLHVSVISSVLFGKYLNWIEFIDTEFPRYRVILGTDRYQFPKEPTLHRTKEPNRRTERPRWVDRIDDRNIMVEFIMYFGNFVCQSQ